MIEREEWEKYEAFGPCDQCAEDRPLVYSPDPFLDEVYPEDGPYPSEWWCYECFKDRKDDV